MRERECVEPAEVAEGRVVLDRTEYLWAEFIAKPWRAKMWEIARIRPLRKSELARI